ncbi:hypothetical protein SAMN04515648_3481 [Phyllobacterium sp. CL33Tsu]|nr:hypothetical protein SAMN04515648_3481 [Phyllobacterium sp. CL33Tsu]
MTLFANGSQQNNAFSGQSFWSTSTSVASTTPTSPALPPGLPGAGNG